jgi:hypothetical protein
VVVVLTRIVSALAFGPVTVIVSPFIALTRPASVAGTSSIDPATLVSVELATIRTFSPSARLAVVALWRRFVTTVEELIT